MTKRDLRDVLIAMLVGAIAAISTVVGVVEWLTR